jgi:hypothetical protein
MWVGGLSRSCRASTSMASTAAAGSGFTVVAVEHWLYVAGVVCTTIVSMA